MVSTKDFMVLVKWSYTFINVIEITKKTATIKLNDEKQLIKSRSVSESKS